MLLGIYADSAAPWLTALSDDPQQRFITELSDAALAGCDCLLVDIRTRQQDILGALAQLKLNLPIVVVVSPEHDFASGYPYGCSVQDLVSTSEIGSAIFWQRISQAVSIFKAPLQVESIRTPVYALLQSIVDYSSDWIILKDLEHRFILASDAFVQQSGYSLEELVGKTDLDIGNSEEQVYGNPETGWAGFWTQDDAVTNSGEISIELNPSWTLFSERPRYKRTLRIPLKNMQGEVYGLLVCAHDITEQKQNELMLRERTEMLARVTAEKKRSEENRVLAEEAVSARNKFIAAASHDLRQPLHAMGLFLDVLESRLEGSDNQALMQRVKQSCASLSGLFNSLLDISRLDAGVVEKDCENIPSARLLASLRDEFRHQAQAKELEYIDSADSSILFSDFMLLSRVIRNLVNNAIDNTASGCITVTCQRSMDSILLSVGDTGRGIPEEERALIFTEFHQIDSQVAERGKGVGLGLAIVKRLCDLLEIDISLQSTTGKGSCFMLRIPVGDASEDEEPQVQPTNGFVSLKDVRALVIDDEAVIRDAMEALLKSHSCITFTAEDADTALEILDKAGQRPDVIIADYQLAHGKTGDSAIARVRSHFQSTIPALLVTGDTANASMQSLSRQGLPTIHKPVDPHLLISTIAEELQGQLDASN